MTAPSPQLNPLPDHEPPHDCARCPRLATLREEVRAQQPDWWNAPVPAFGDPSAWLGIIGLAPGRQGAHRTGRVFTGDHAGALLFETLKKFGFTQGEFDNRADDGLTLNGAMIVNAVRCLPPANKPTPEEIRNCRPFLEAQAEAMPTAHIYIALGEVAHQSAVKILGGKLPKCRFSHGAVHRVPDGRMLIDSYHCSRLNHQTGRLTSEMFDAVFEKALELREAIVRGGGPLRRPRPA